MLESAIKVDDLTDLAKKNDMSAVALTDRGNLFASLEFALSATKKGIQPIQGVILNLKYDRLLAELVSDGQALGVYGAEDPSVSSIYENLSTGVAKQLMAEVELSKQSSANAGKNILDDSERQEQGNYNEHHDLASGNDIGSGNDIASGNEVTLGDNVTFGNKTASNHVSFRYEQQDDFAEILLIAKDEQGYKNLLTLVSNSFIKNDRSVCEHITISDLIKAQEGLIALSAYDQGIIGKLLLAGRKKEAKAVAEKFLEIFADRFYFEIMRTDSASNAAIEADYLEIARECMIPLIATNQVLFSTQDMHDAHDVLLCISQGVVKEMEDRKRASKQSYFKSAREMQELFADLPEAIENSVYLAQRCYVMAETHPPSLPNFTDGTISEDTLIRKEAATGLDQRLKLKFEQENIDKERRNAIREEYFERLNYELDIICKMQFSGYFLIVSDFICWSKENGIAVGPGRGSGAGSIIAWALKITDLDPIKFGLLFERFLNPERVSMPDFDIDFCQERREEVIDYVRRKYGDMRVGQIITFGKMQAKAVIKDVSRVLGLQYSFADQLTELVPFNAVNPVTLADAINEVAELSSAAMGKGLYNMPGENELIKQVLDTALILEGLHRHASTHAAGIVIANENMIDTIPLYKDSLDANMLIVQYSMKYCELAGLVKFDFLGLQTLTVITKCLEHLKERDIHIDMEKVPFDDATTYELLSKGLSTGVFQFESAGMKNSLRKLRPDCIEDIIALGALYRPGPMENIPTYIACKHGDQKPDYLHPLLEQTLKETNGVIIYQEQVMEIAKILSGYSLGAADLLRRAMGKKVKAEMDAQEEMFVSGAIANNVAAGQAKSIFATVAKFAGYGFNKSHASAYGVISYQTAYLKANFPAEFLVACLNLDIDNSDKINIYLQEARVLGIEILPPCINRSSAGFRVQYNEDNRRSIVFAISAIKNVSKNFGKFVEEERDKGGDYKSINNFLERLEPKLINKRLLENIIKAGVFDELFNNRNSLLASCSRMLSYCQSYHQEQQSSQFSLIKVSQSSGDFIIASPPLSPKETALGEFEVFGLFLTNHPLTGSREMLEKMGVKDSLYIKDELQEGSYVINLAGVLIKKDSRMSSRGRFITLLISDPGGIFEVTIFSEEILKEYAHLLSLKSEVVIQCDIYKDEGGLRVTAKKFFALDEYVAGLEHDLVLYPQNSKQLVNIVELLSSRCGSEKKNSKVTIFLQGDNGYLGKVLLEQKFYLDTTDLEQLTEQS